MSLLFEAVTHIGNKRQSNEDRYFARQQDDGSLLMAVADGVGGMPGGDKAAGLAIQAVAAAGIGEKLCFVFTNGPDILGTTKPGSDSGEKNCFIGYGKE